MSGKEIIIAVITSVILTSGLMYVGLPVLYPNMSTSYTPPEEGYKGVVLQSKYVEFKDAAYIFDDETGNFTLMNQTQATLTITGTSSRLAAHFSAFSLMTLTDTFSGMCSFEISIVVNNSLNVQVTNRTFSIAFFDASSATGFYRQIVFDLDIDLVTSQIDAGSYTVALYWRSMIDSPGFNSLSVNHNTDWRYPRSLWLFELDTI